MAELRKFLFPEFMAACLSYCVFWKFKDMCKTYLVKEFYIVDEIVVVLKYNSHKNFYSTCKLNSRF